MLMGTVGATQTVSAGAMDVADNLDFQRRVSYFMSKAAVAVMAEVNTTNGHALRVAYAKTVLTGLADIHAYAISVMTNGVIAAAGFSAADSDLEFTVNSMFSAFAGVAT